MMAQKEVMNVVAEQLLIKNLLQKCTKAEKKGACLFFKIMHFASD